MIHFDANIAGRNIRVDFLQPSRVIVEDVGYDVERLASKPQMVMVRIGLKYYNAFINKKSEFDYELWINHHVIRVTLEDEKRRLLSRFSKGAASASGLVIVYAPMPGLVVEVNVKVGEIITTGKSLITLEAMKMENEIRSVASGRVKKIMVGEKSAVEKNQPLLLVEALEIS